MRTGPASNAEKHINGPHCAPFDIKAHPDNEPWSKCCCGDNDESHWPQCFMKKTTAGDNAGRSRFEKNGGINNPTLREIIDEDGRFFCVHRLTDDGYHRCCAGWAAKFGKNRR